MQSKTLAASGCSVGRVVHREVWLSDDQLNAIVAKLTSLQTTCETSCGADAFEIGGNIRDCAGSVETTFNSNFYAGCAGRTIAPPYVTYDDLLSLRTVIVNIFLSSCDGADAGSPGTCGGICRQGAP